MPEYLEISENIGRKNPFTQLAWHGHCIAHAVLLPIIRRVLRERSQVGYRQDAISHRTNVGQFF